MTHLERVRCLNAECPLYDADTTTDTTGLTIPRCPRCGHQAAVIIDVDDDPLPAMTTTDPTERVYAYGDDLWTEATNGARHHYWITATGQPVEDPASAAAHGDAAP